jgi:hypothetical protein
MLAFTPDGAFVAQHLLVHDFLNRLPKDETVVSWRKGLRDLVSKWVNRKFRIGFYGLPGYGKSTLVSRLISKDSAPLLVSPGVKDEGDTMVPVEANFADIDYVEVHVSVLSEVEWRARRKCYASLLIPDEEVKLTKKQANYLHSSIKRVYGDIDGALLQRLTSDDFEEPEPVKEFLRCPKYFAFPRTDNKCIQECIAAFATDLGGLHFFVKKVEIFGRFDMPESVVLVDLPGALDAKAQILGR